MVSTQDITGGTIRYEQHTYYKWDYTLAGDLARDIFFANLPTIKVKGMIFEVINSC